MPRIGLLSPFLPEKDGIAIYSDNLLRGLGKERKNIVTIGRRGSKADHIIDFRSFSLKKDMERIIKKRGLTAIHIQYVPSLFGKYNLNYNLIRALDLPIRTIVTLHEVHYSKKGPRNRILMHIQEKIIQKADKIIVHTPKQKEFLDKKYNTKKIITIYHGLRLNKVPSKKDKKNILYFGMISRGKGVPYLIKAMKYLPDCNLTIAGKFIDKKTKKETITTLKRSASRIKTDFGWVSEEKKEEYYKDAAIVALPYVWAPYQSGVLHNAVAWGLPVVVTKVGALWEMADRFKFGEIIPPRNQKALAEGIRKVFKEYQNYKKGITRYRNSANWRKIALEHLRVYKNE